MKVRILRLEKAKDSSGNDEIFMMVEANTGDSIYTRAEWLTADEVIAINSDDSQKNIIAEEMAERAVLAKAQEITEISQININNPN